MIENQQVQRTIYENEIDFAALALQSPTFNTLYGHIVEIEINHGVNQETVSRATVNSTSAIQMPCSKFPFTS